MVKLKGHRLKLSPFDESDMALFIEMSMCSKMMEHVYDPFSFDEAQKAFDAKSVPWTWESTSWLSLGITEISTGNKLGNIGLKIVNQKAKIAEVGFMIKQSAQGRGFACEALGLVKDHAFNVLNLNKLIAICSVHNIGSYKLLEKFGFKREGCLQKNAVIDNKFVDDYIYGYVNSDFSL